MYKAARKGVAESQFYLAMIYNDGKNVAKDEAKALKWLEHASKQEHTEAQFNLGMMHANGRGVLKDDAAALNLLMLAATIKSMQKHNLT